jgi:hypothetical protein
MTHAWLVHLSTFYGSLIFWLFSNLMWWHMPICFHRGRTMAPPTMLCTAQTALVFFSTGILVIWVLSKCLQLWDCKLKTKLRQVCTDTVEVVVPHPCPPVYLRDIVGQGFSGYWALLQNTEYEWISGWNHQSIFGVVLVFSALYFIYDFIGI